MTPNDPQHTPNDPQHTTPAPGLGPTSEQIKKAASESMREGVDIRSKIHDVTLLALRSAPLRPPRHAGSRARGDRAAWRWAPRTAGPTCARRWRRRFAAWTRRSRVRRKPGGAALRQLAVTGKDLSDTEIKQALAHDEEARGRFPVDRRPRRRGGERARCGRSSSEILDTARKPAPRPARWPRRTMTELTQRFSVASLDVAIAGMEVAAEVGIALRAAGERHPGRHRRRAGRPAHRQETALSGARMLQVAFSTMRDLPRLHEITSVLIRHGLGDVVQPPRRVRRARAHRADPAMGRVGRVA